MSPNRSEGMFEDESNCPDYLCAEPNLDSAVACLHGDMWAVANCRSPFIFGLYGPCQPYAMWLSIWWKLGGDGGGVGGETWESWSCEGRLHPTETVVCFCRSGGWPLHVNISGCGGGCLSADISTWLPPLPPPSSFLAPLDSPSVHLPHFAFCWWAHDLWY